MNNKDNKLLAIVDAVVGCCQHEVNDKKTVTSELVLSKNRNENVVLTRQIVAMQLSHFGYTTTTIAMLLSCTTANVRKLLRDGYNNLQTRYCFNIAYSEATLLCKEVIQD